MWESTSINPIFIQPPPLVRPEQGLCEAAGLKEGEAQEHRVPHAPPDGAGNVVAAQGDALHQHRVDAHADHDEERLEAQGQQGAEIVLPRVAPFPVHHRGKRDGPDRGHQIHLDHPSAEPSAIMITKRIFTMHFWQEFLPEQAIWWSQIRSMALAEVMWW